MNRKNHKGGATVEFAFVLPVLLLLMAAFVDFGMAFYNKQVLTNASREGARAGIVNLKDPGNGEKIAVSADEIETIVEDYIDNAVLWDVVGSAELNTVVQGVGANYPSDLSVRVTLEDYEPLLSPLYRLFGGNFDTFDISVVTIMRME